MIPRDFGLDIRRNLVQHSKKNALNILIGLTQYWRYGSIKHNHDPKLWRNGHWLHAVGDPEHLHAYLRRYPPGKKRQQLRLAKRLLKESHKALEQRRDYTEIIWELQAYHFALWPCIFLEVYQAATEYLRRLDVDLLYELYHCNDEQRLIDLGEIIDLVNEKAYPLPKPNVYRRTLSEQENDCSPELDGL